MKKTPPNIKTLHKLLRHEPDTGLLFWRERTPDMFEAGGHSAVHNCRKWNARWAGVEAFTADRLGYKQGTIFHQKLSAHRVIWALHYGEWPEDEIDHINHDRSDNRISNLRCVTRCENSKNLSMRGDNKSGITGVCWDKSRNKWSSQIMVNSCTKNLGRFGCITAASISRKLAEIKYGFYKHHGGTGL